MLVMQQVLMTEGADWSLEYQDTGGSPDAVAISFSFHA